MPQASTPHILIYSTPTCPDCRALKEWLSQQSIAFEERDLTDLKISAEVKSRTGGTRGPDHDHRREVFYGTFASQKPG
jgi:predicted DsbA family dithiol-disulfide isomerase